MMQRRATLFALACLASAAFSLAACSKPGGGANAASASAPTAAAAAAPTANACDRHLIANADVQPLLSEPISTEESLKGDEAASCVFKTAGFSSVTVMLRPGMGSMTLDAWKKGQMNLAVTALPGVGDDAVWQDTLKEVIARKGELLCDIHAIGPASTPATSAKVGALCTKIFAAG